MSEEIKSIIEEPFYPEDCTDIRAQKNSKRIEKIEEKIGQYDSIPGRMDDVEEDVEDLKERVSTAEGKIEDLEGAVSSKASCYKQEIELTTSAWSILGEAEVLLGNVVNPFTIDNLYLVGDGDDLTEEQREAIQAANITVSVSTFTAASVKLTFKANGQIPQVDITLNLAVFR